MFVREKGLTDKREIRVQTRSGIIVPRVADNGEVTVDMGPPVFEPAARVGRETAAAPLSGRRLVR